jgi:ABC-type polysaccharide/polyol phosphate transport system ATPase subunit
MTSINLKDVTVEFPIYNINARSLKKNFLRLATGGSVSKDAHQHVVVRSLNNISLSIINGDRIGLIGHNGSGKSTLLRLFASIYEPTSGLINIEGKVSTLLSLMQGIENEFTGYENIMQRGIILGLKKNEIKKNIENIAEMTGLGDYLSMPVRTYSSGMMVRLAFAISTSIQPEILLIDEVFGAGDAAFMEKARHRMLELLNKSSIVVIATHADELIKEFCNKALLLENGQVKYFGDVETAFNQYRRESMLNENPIG